MITEPLIDVFLFVMEMVTSALPTLEFLDYTTGLETVTKVYSTLVPVAAFFLPIGYLLTGFALMLVIINYHHLLFMVNWVIKRIRGG